jgi:hypothetical protein
MKSSTEPHYQQLKALFEKNDTSSITDNNNNERYQSNLLSGEEPEPPKIPQPIVTIIYFQYIYITLY